jgi:2-polyprenyl-6-methoxyphenol hydroxylase-like FAD-dependent oxidoreductase
MKFSILICGAGVAGLSTAHFLLRAGHAVTIVERSPTFRGGGQAVDVRGVALDGGARMGQLEAVRDNPTQLKGK